MKRVFYWIIALLASLCLLACEDTVETDPEGQGGAHLVTIAVDAQDPQLVMTRTHSEEAVKERIENMAFFVFQQDGTLYKKMFQLFNSDKAVVNIYLSDTTYTVCAVCNLEDPETFYYSIGRLEDLENYPLILEQPAEAFRGKYMMSGKEELTVNAVTDNYTVRVSRMVAEHQIDIHFIPDDENDNFKITKVKMHQLPQGCWMLPRSGGEAATEGSKSDWTFNNDAEKMAAHYFPTEELEVDHLTDTKETKYSWQCQTVFHSLENRRGGVVTQGTPPYDYQAEYWKNSDLYAPEAEKGDEKSKMLLENCRQIKKKVIGQRLGTDGKLYGEGEAVPSGVRMKFENATYLTIEGVYRRFDLSTWKVTYYVYLGADNYKDFNIRRNTKYKTSISIRSLERVDLRVEAEPVGNMIFSASDAIFDAHCCVRRAVIAAQGDWEAWVVDPDKTPWLELSKSEHYHARRVGAPVSPEHPVAAYRLTGSAGLDYVFIHLDEYLPDLKNPMENSRHEVREGRIAYKMGNKPVQYFKVRQYPAQMGVLHIKYDVHDMKEICDTFYIERILEKKHMSWGLETFWSNVTDDLIAAGRWDGLANTRRLNNVALHGDKWGIDPHYKDEIPDEVALGYAVHKNRDRDGNEHIDNDEILWYWPAVKELQYLRQAINDGHLNFESNDDYFHSSTPSSADPYGATMGFSYYVTMGDGKLGVGQRDRLYNVICMRRKNREWHGPKGEDVKLNITVETGWNDEEIVMPVP